MTRDFAMDVFLTREELSELLSTLPEDNVDSSGDFFARFGLGELYSNNRFYETLNRGHDLLDLCNQINTEVYQNIHKGAPFYWMGMSAYRIHDFQTAIYYIDAAVSEEVKYYPEDHDTPARLFLRLEGEDKRQRAKPIVEGAQKSIEDYINFYNDIIVASEIVIPKLTIQDVRKYLLKPASLNNDQAVRSLATTFISFFLEYKYRDFQLRLRTESGTNEPILIHLFKGCLLFESLLKFNPNKKVKGNKLSSILKSLIGIPGFPEEIKIGSINLQRILREAEALNDHIATAITTTGRLRNATGHYIAWSTEVTSDQYLNAFLLVAVSCLHTISVLYRNEIELPSNGEK